MRVILRSRLRRWWEVEDLGGFPPWWEKSVHRYEADFEPQPWPSDWDRRPHP